MEWVTILGYCAALTSTVGFLPQTIKAFKTKHTKDISLWMYVILIAGLILWLLYGIFSLDWPIIIANIITLLLIIPVLILKILYK
jgi:MtN3 and saliva related transmembrane protein